MICSYFKAIVSDTVSRAICHNVLLCDIICIDAPGTILFAFRAVAAVQRGDTGCGFPSFAVGDELSKGVSAAGSASKTTISGGGELP